MSEIKHTPGPWSIWTSNSYRRIGSDSTGMEVCYGTVQPDGHTDLGFSNGGFNGPDARLIAAAPELLEALAKIVDSAEQRAFEDWLASNSPSGCVEQVQDQWEQSSEFDDFCEDWEIERAAIAKATGA